MPPKSVEAPMTWQEIGFLCEGMSFASRPMHAATLEITAQFSLGPRGAWMLVLIDNGHVFPLDMANVFRIGRSLISAELVRLTDAGLISAVKSAEDGRRTRLALTDLGKETSVRVRDKLYAQVVGRLSAYSREEMMLCARMLRDWRTADDGGGRR